MAQKYCQIILESLEINDNFASRSERNTCPGGGIGRRAGLKHLWVHPRTGSTPVLGTKL